MKNLTQFLTITQEATDTAENTEEFGVKRDWLDAEDVLERFKKKPNVAKAISANCPKYPKWHSVWMQCLCSCLGVLLVCGCIGVCCCVLCVGV